MMNHKIKVTCLVGICLVSTSFRVISGGIPTIDVANIIQTSISAIEAGEQTIVLHEQLANAYNQYQQLQEQYTAITGSRGMGGLLTTAQQMSNRRWSPDNLAHDLRVINAGGIPGTDASYKLAIKRLNNATGALASDDMHMHDEGYLSNEGKFHDESVSSNLNAVGLSETLYEKSDTRNDDIEELMDKIDTADDQKAALDLSNTLQATSLVFLNDSMRMQAVSLQNQAVFNSNIDAARTMEAQFYQRP